MTANDASPARNTDGDARRETTVSYEHSVNFPTLLERIGVSLVVSTYQAGKVFTVGVLDGGS